MSAQAIRALLFKRKAVALILLPLLILIPAAVLMRPPSENSDAGAAARIVPINPSDIASRRDAIAWKPSGEAAPRSMPSAPAATKISAFPSDIFPPEPERVNRASDAVPSESPLPDVRRNMPHDPTVISVPAWIPPAMRDAPAANWQVAGSISATQAIAYRQRIAQGEKIFKRAPDRTPGVLDGVRGKRSVNTATAEQSTAMGGNR